MFKKNRKLFITINIISVMKKFNFLAFVALCGMFFVCSCGGSGSSNSNGVSSSVNGGGDVMSILNEAEDVLDEAFSKIKKAGSMEELERINKWAEKKMMALKEKLEAYAERHPEEFERKAAQIETKMKKIDKLYNRCDDLYEEREDELENRRW